MGKRPSCRKNVNKYIIIILVLQTLMNKQAAASVNQRMSSAILSLFWVLKVSSNQAKHCSALWLKYENDIYLAHSILLTARHVRI